MSGELHDWAKDVGLSHDIITFLLDQGFNSLADLRNLTPEDVTECFQKTGLLPLPKCLALRQAIAHMFGGGPPSYSPRLHRYNTSDDPLQPGEPSPYGQKHRLYDHGLELQQRQTYQPQGASYLPRDAPLKPHAAPYRPVLEQERSTTQGAERSRPDLHHDEPDLSTAMGSISLVRRQSGKDTKKCRLLLLGKTGSGKSKTANTILDENLFKVSSGFDSVTVDCELKRNNKNDRKMEIMDSPGLFDTLKSHEQLGTIIIQSVAGMHPGPNAILYVVRMGRYTAEEYSAYNRLKALFDDSITKHMIVLFTGGDELERNGENLDDKIKCVSDNLKNVLAECSHRYILFNNFAIDPRPQVERLLDMVRQLDRQNGGPYVCPKYMKIGESLEAEVARRMEVVDKKELERLKYVQQLQQQTEDTQQALSKAKEDMERKEQEQNRQMEQLTQQQQQQVQALQQQMEEQKLSDEKRVEEERALRERQKAEIQSMREMMQEQRKEDQRRFEIMEKEHTQKEQEIREFYDRRYETLMDNVKAQTVAKNDQEFFGFLRSMADLALFMAGTVIDSLDSD